MIQDARARTDTLGKIDAILLGGDIAYRADPIEYVAASRWISELAQACGCSLERVFVVPGNHDVDRGIIAQKRGIQYAQRAITSASDADRAGELKSQLEDSSVGHAHFEPLAAYNDFAKSFNCQVYPAKLFWKQDLNLRDDVVLRIHGLTSTVLSGAVVNGKQDEKRGELYLSPWQAVLNPADDVVNVVISHHPPDWFMDHDDVEDKTRARAALHFFGHKHRQRCVRDMHYARFDAGAVNPDPNELAWHPAYNIIRVEVAGNGPARTLQIEANLFTWQTQPECYVHIKDTAAQGSDIWRHSIPIPGRTDAKTASALPVPFAPPLNPPDGEAAMGEQSTRRLVTRWWRLPMNARREIAV